MLAKKNEQENQQLKKENQQLKKENQQLKEQLSRKQSQPEERPNDEQEQINKQIASQILCLQEQINKQNEIITKLQDHVNQVFGEEGSIEDEVRTNVARKMMRRISTKTETMIACHKIPLKVKSRVIVMRKCQEGGTDFTQCVATENDKRCVRIRRNGSDYCWIHNPENPQTCKKCKKPLKIKQGVIVNGRTKDSTGLFEDCDCKLLLMLTLLIQLFLSLFPTPVP